MSSKTESDSDEETAKIRNQNSTASSEASTATFLRTGADLPTRALQIVSSSANAVSSVKINAPAVIEAEIEDTSAIYKFFLDPKNRALTDEDGNTWWFDHAFNALVFEGSFDAVSRTWSRLLQGPFKDEIKYPNLNDVQYVKVDEIALRLFEKEGPGFTPVRTILGLQKIWNLRRMNQEELVLAATNAAASGMSDAEARCRFGPKFVPPLAADEELAWTLCEIDQLSRSNGASATSGKQAGDSTSRITSEHVLGLLALNGAPSNANSPWSAWSHDQVLGMCA